MILSRRDLDVLSAIFAPGSTMPITLTLGGAAEFGEFVVRMRRAISGDLRQLAEEDRKRQDLERAMSAVNGQEG